VTAYGRASIGYAHTWSSVANFAFDNAVVVGDAGARYQLGSKFSVGVEPLSFALLFANGHGVQYRPTITASGTF
jgi:hypothetical protein